MFTERQRTRTRTITLAFNGRSADRIAMPLITRYVGFYSLLKTLPESRVRHCLFFWVKGEATDPSLRSLGNQD